MRFLAPLLVGLFCSCGRQGSLADAAAKGTDPPGSAARPAPMQGPGTASSAIADAPSSEDRPEKKPGRPHSAPVCDPAERAFFECHVRDGSEPKVARICGSREHTVQVGYLVFLYGPPARTETEIVVPVARLGETARFARYTRPLTTGLAAGFADGDKRFELEQWDVEDVTPAERSASLALYEGDDRKAPLSCSPLPKVSLSVLEDWFPPRDGFWTGGSLW